MAWYQNWFDTDYYHSLYQHRDESEAEQLVQKISDSFPAAKYPFLCDAACWKKEGMPRVLRIRVLKLMHLICRRIALLKQKKF